MEYKKVNIQCSKCENTESFVKEVNGLEFGECTNCHSMTYSKRVSQPTYTLNKKVIVNCPYCNSSNTTKISTLSKVGNVALFGIFALNKTSKQWHCNTCKSDF